MANKNRKKRKNSSEGDSAHTSKSNKEAKSGSPGAVNSSLFNTNQYLYSTPLSNYIPVNNMNTMSSPNGSVFNSPAGLNMQYPMGGMGPMGIMPNGLGVSSSPGSCMEMSMGGSVPSFNMANLMNPQQTVTSATAATSQSSGNQELMQFLTGKFDEVNKRLEKLDVLEKRVNDIDLKVSKLWSDLDKRVTENTEKVTSVEQKAASNEFDIGQARDNITKLQKQNQELKDEMNDMKSKGMIGHLIIGGVDEGEEGMDEDTEETVRAFMYHDLKIPRDRVAQIKLERVQRTGLKALNRSRKILAVFKDVRDKTYVKSFRKNLDQTNKFIHDQYPPEVVAYRKKLIPFMKRAKDDGKEAYIKYNKLIVEGQIYTDGAYGKVPE